MPGDCVGDSEVAAAAAGVQGMVVNDAPSQQPAVASDEKDWAKIVEEKKPYYEKRVNMFAAIKAKHEAGLEAAKAANIPIKVILPDGSEKPGIKNVTNPMDIANSISKSLAKKTIVAKVDGKVWDLLRPLEGDCALQLCSFDDPDGKETFWHSSAHLLGQALELEFGADLTIGPALEEGFYYDCYLGDDKNLAEADKERIVKRMQTSVKDKHVFERVVITKHEALDMFSENKFKVEMISAFP
ncbi:hypothetical protein Ndes2437A_g01958 [Nannochloris sp. 'desiccata']